MSDDAFDTMASSSAAAATPSQQQDSLILSAKELRATPVDKREAPPSEGLTAHWKRTKVTGKGVDLLENIANLFDDDTVLDSDRVGFLQVRLMAPKTKKTPARKPQKKKDGDNNLSYVSCRPDIKRGLDQSRCKE